MFLKHIRLIIITVFICFQLFQYQELPFSQTVIALKRSRVKINYKVLSQTVIALKRSRVKINYKVREDMEMTDLFVLDEQMQKYMIEKHIHNYSKVIEKH